MWEFERVLATLRSLAYPCAPPIGVGEFDVLYASEREVVVWYSPVREGQRAGEVAIPCVRLAAAWAALTDGAMLNEAALSEYGAGIAGGRWLLALLALVPGVRVQSEPLALAWSPRPADAASATAKKPRTRRTAAQRAAPTATARPRRKPPMGKLAAAQTATRVAARRTPPA